MSPRSTRSTSTGKPDIRTVASLARVSIATVSRTINGSSAVSDKLSKRVWQAIEQLNYFPNTHARSLVSGRSRILGIIVENITNPFFPELIASFEEIAVAHGYELLVSSGNIQSAAQIETIVRRMLERKVEGVAVLTFGSEESVLDQLVNHGIPLVLAEFEVNNPRVSTILIDYASGIREAVEHLVNLGHRKIAYLAGPHTLHSAETRLHCFESSTAVCGLRIRKEWIVDADHTLKGGEAGMQRLLGLKERPTAVICSNDMTAIGVLHAAHQARLAVPEELSVIGLDDIAFTEFTLPPLTTIGLSRHALARAAFDALRVQVEALNEPGKHVPNQRRFEVTTTLIARESTAPPKA